MPSAARKPAARHHARAPLAGKGAAPARGRGKGGYGRRAEVDDGYRHGCAPSSRLPAPGTTPSPGGPDLDTCACAGLTPIIWALRFEHLLVAEGARTDACDVFGRQPLRHAATSACSDGVWLILAQGDVDADARP